MNWWLENSTVLLLFCSIMANSRASLSVGGFSSKSLLFIYSSRSPLTNTPVRNSWATLVARSVALYADSDNIKILSK